MTSDINFIRKIVRKIINYKAICPTISPYMSL